MQEKLSIFNIPVNNLTLTETINIVNNAILTKNQIHYADLNAEKVVTLQSNHFLKKIYEETHIINVDGMAVYWASKLLGIPLKERIAGIDLMSKLIDFSAQSDFTVYLLGAKEEVVSELSTKINNDYKKNVVVGYRNGYFSLQEEIEVINEIINLKPNMLFVGITSPKKEIFLYTHKNKLKDINLIMGVGGSFDVLSGKIKRAPKWIQKIGMEWAFRTIQEPKRLLKRYIVGNTKFLLLVFKEKFKISTKKTFLY